MPNLPRAVERALRAYDELHARLMTIHTPDLVDVELTLAQLKTIYVVAASGPLSMGVLAERLGTTLSTTSGSVDRLVRGGFLARREDPDDRRQVLVEVTPTALDQIDRMSELGRIRLRTLLASLRADDLATIEGAFRILADAVTEHTKENR